MKKLYLLFLFILVLINTVYPQKQLTEVQNLVPTLKYQRTGLVTIDSTEYLLEVNLWSLRVSTIEEDSVFILYEVTDYPFNNELTYWYGRMKTRSGFIIDGIYLYEFFTKQIRKRNLLTSEIVEVYSFPNHETLSIRNMDSIGNLIHFKLGEEGSFSYYNIETKEYTTLPFDPRYTFKDQNFFYSKEDNSGIIKFNALDGTTEMLFQNEDSHFFGKQSKLNGQAGLVFGIFDKMRFLNKDTTFLLGCDNWNFFAFDTDIHETEEYYIKVYDDCNSVTIRVIDKADCSIYYSESFELDCNDDRNLTFFNSSVFDKDYILFANNHSSWFDESKLFLFDKNELTISQVGSYDIRIINEDSFYKIEDEIYFIGKEPIFDHNEQTLYSLNLVTKQLNNIPNESIFFNPISFGSSKNDSTFLIGKNINLIPTIYKFYDNEDVKNLHTADDTRNLGLTSTRYLALDEDKIAYEFKDSVYFISNSENTKINSTPILEATDISNLVFENQSVKGLVSESDSTYLLSYDFNTKLITTTPLNKHFVDLQINSIAQSNYILGQFSIDNKLYFHLDSESFEDLPIDNNIISIHQSKQHVIFLTQCESSYCLTSLIEGEFSDFQFSFQNKPEIYSKKNGGYIILERNLGQNKTVYAIDKEGKFVDKINVEGIKLAINQIHIQEGPLSAMMFYDQQTLELEVILQQHHIFHSFRIPFNNAYSFPITWYKSGKNLVLKSEDDNDPGIYICTLGKEVKKLMLNDVDFSNHKLLMAIAKENILSLMVDSSLDGFQVAVYDVDADNINSITELNFDTYLDIKYTENRLHTKHQITEDQYLVTFIYDTIYEEYEDGKIFIFDTNTNQLNYYYINDLANNPVPYAFISDLNNLYFIAKTRSDNSYQLFNYSSSFITSNKNTEIKNVLSRFIHIKPNPSSQNISIERDANQLLIYNSLGIEIKSIKGYNANEEIGISGFEDGAYIIMVNINNKWITSKFIKI